MEMDSHTSAAGILMLNEQCGFCSGRDRLPYTAMCVSDLAGSLRLASAAPAWPTPSTLTVWSSRGAGLRDA